MGAHLWSGRLYIYAGSKDWTDNIVTKLSKKKRKSKYRKIKQKDKRIESSKKQVVRKNQKKETKEPKPVKRDLICIRCKHWADKKCSITGLELEYRSHCLLFTPIK